MFKIAPNPTFLAEVAIPVPGGGKEKLKLVFKHKTREQLEQYIERSRGTTPEEEPGLLTEIIDGWQDVDQEFSREALAELLSNHHGAGFHIMEAYIDELTGRRRGN